VVLSSSSTASSRRCFYRCPLSIGFEYLSRVNFLRRYFAFGYEVGKMKPRFYVQRGYHRGDCDSRW
jgi:hypothetical protein